MSEKFILGIVDYAILVITLAISTVIGIYFRLFGRQQKSNVEYLLAGKDMPILPVSFSLMATFMSATTLMGIPAEMYLFGTNLAFLNIGLILSPIICSYVFLPIYFKIQVTTSYEYLEKRFGKSTRRLLSGIFLLQSVLYSSVALSAPALALSAVTNLTVWASVISIGVVCTFYSTMGGMKAVLWTDVFQSCLMYICLLAIIIRGCIVLGGIENIFKTAYDDGRILFPTLNMDFSTRYTIWNILLQGLIIVSYWYAGNQLIMQRQLTVKNLKRSQMASLLSIPMLTIFQLLCCLCGLIFYVYFKSCDPMTSPTKPIHSADQLMPFFITSALSQYPGIPGLCIAGIFSASLSTVSSAINSMAAVTYEDIIHPIWPNLSRPVLITKIASVFYGTLTIFVTFLVASLGNLVKATILVLGMASGPSLGVYILAALTTTANEMGTNLGVIAGLLLSACTTFIPNERYYPTLPVGRNCSEPLRNVLNFSTMYDTTYLSMNRTDLPAVESAARIFAPDNFPVSYMWISSLSLATSVIVGYFSSWIISCFRDDSKAIPHELLSPVCQWFYRNDQGGNNIKDQKNRQLKADAISRF